MKKEKRVCLVSTQYTLLLYLLFSSLEEIHDTFYIITDCLSPNFASKFDKSTFIKDVVKIKGVKVRQWLYCLYLRLFIINFVNKNTHIFAQDHLAISTSLLYDRDYILIEDSPYISSIYRNSNLYKKYEKSKKSWKYPILKFLHGKTFSSAFGNNDRCKGILMSVEDDYVDFLEGKKRYICDFQEAWANASQKKKDFILSVFSITKEDIDDLKKYQYILFTQPLYPDFLDKEEHEQIFAKIIANYPKEKLIIKKHPRDVCDYASLAPGVKLFDKNIPSQLLDLLGIKFELGITPFSSAVFNISYPIQIDWYGTECHPKLLKMFGHLPPPENAKTYQL